MPALRHEGKREARPADRRKVERRPVRGEVRLFVEGPPLAEVRGRLADASGNSFRAIHHYPALEAGQEVRFILSGRSGIARVIWNRIVGKGKDVETGFFVLSP